MSNTTTYTLILNQSGIKAFTMPIGYWPDVEIYCWGAGGGFGYNGTLGGGGGYAKASATINPGDEVILQIGLPGQNGTNTGTRTGGVDPTYRAFRGGNSGRATAGVGAGGGAASFVAVNGAYLCVAAGGGGAGGIAGNPGGVVTGTSTTYRGGDSLAFVTTGGGGGSGYPKGGIAGISAGSGLSGGGSGGQNFGNVTLAGAGNLPGGKSVSYYPGNKVGEAGSQGYVVLVFRKKLNAYIKNANASGNWTKLESAFVKVPTKKIFTTRAFQPATLAYSTAGTTTWVVPQGVTSITFQAAGGAGGAGGGDVGGDKNNTAGGGGGGSNFISATVAVTPGQVYTFNVGRGGAGSAGGGTGGTGETTSISLGGSVILAALGATGGTRGHNNGHGVGGTGSNGAGNGSSLTGGKSTNGGPTGGTGVARYYSTGGTGGSGSVRISFQRAPEQVLTVTGGWKEIQQAFTKVNGKWKPILTEKAVNLYNYPVKRVSANVVISASTTDYNLYNNLPVAYFEGIMDVSVWILPGVVITGNATSNSFTVDNFSGGDRINVINYGQIQGRGGDGGGGGIASNYYYGYNYYYGFNGSNIGYSPSGVYNYGYVGFGQYYLTGYSISPPGKGGPGGTALNVSQPITLENNGIIAGGGGGGGGGGAGNFYSYWWYGWTNNFGQQGGRGGGGAGYGTGASNGTLTTGGPGQVTASNSGDGGAGGNRGLVGVSGQAGNAYYNYYNYFNQHPTSAGVAGGAAGYAIVGRNNVIITTTGTIIGPVSG